MIYTNKIQEAIRFSIKTHELDEKQKRKGKDIPYITHPLTVGLILAATGASEDVIVAGILHDTIEDSVSEKKVTGEMISEVFGENVGQLVLSVTEQDKSLSWEERKAEAIEHIETMSHDSLLLKSADILANASDVIDDYNKDGDAIFKRFGGSKEKVLNVYINKIKAIQGRWSNNPLATDLAGVVLRLEKIKTPRTDYGQITINALRRMKSD
jgi:(p)ppGpp synthase/HD superfamily hydrolase